MDNKNKYKRSKIRQDRIPNKSIIENVNNVSNTTSTTANSSSNKLIDLGLDKFSYADYIILTSLAAYAIGEDLNDNDLDLTILFFSILSSDLALIRTKRGILQRQQIQNNLGNITADTTIDSGSNALTADLTRKVKVKKKKYVKKKRKNNEQTKNKVEK